jgi:hypothetical protein
VIRAILAEYSVTPVLQMSAGIGLNDNFGPEPQITFWTPMSASASSGHSVA